MKRAILGLFILGFFAIGAVSATAQDAAAVIDKAIKAHGGEEALGKVKAYSISGKQTMKFGDAESTSTLTVTTKGIDHSQQKFEGEFNGDKFEGVFVLAGDKGWINFNGNGNAMPEDQVKNSRRTTYLEVLAITLLPLKSKDFKTKLGGDEKVGDKPAVTVKATGPDGKEFTAFFDKESGMLVKISAPGVLGFQNDEFTQDMLFTDYKEMGGIKKATKYQTLRDGNKFLDREITEFKVLDKVEDSTFAEPK